MLFSDHLVVVRGGGDLGTGVVARLHRAGFPVVVLELDRPLAIRRTVAVASAVATGEAVVEDVTARLVANPAEAVAVARTGAVAVLVSPALPDFAHAASVVVDARMAKRNLGTAPGQAPLVIALGPGFVAGVDCDAVIETRRGHHLGRVLWQGSAAPDTGRPGTVGGKTGERVLRAPAAGAASWLVDIADHVEAGQVLGSIGGEPLTAPFAGIVRGLLAPGLHAGEGMKVGDVDPRGEPQAAFEISDKALAVGGGVLEAVLTWLNRG